MYAVDNETFQRARSIVSALSQELVAQEDAAVRRPVDPRLLIRRSADVDLPEDGEVAYLAGLVADLARLFPVEELFPRRRRGAQQG